MNTRKQATLEDVQPNERRPAPKGRDQVPRIRHTQTKRNQNYFSPYPAHRPPPRFSHRYAYNGSYSVENKSGPSRLPESWITEANNKLREEQRKEIGREARKTRHQIKSEPQKLQTISIDLPEHCRTEASNSSESRRIFIQNFKEGMLNQIAAKISSHAVREDVLYVYYYAQADDDEPDANSRFYQTHLQEASQSVTKCHKESQNGQNEQYNHDSTTETSKNKGSQSVTFSNVETEISSRPRSPSLSDVHILDNSDKRESDDNQPEPTICNVAFTRSRSLAHRNFRSGVLLLEPETSEVDLFIDLNGSGSIRLQESNAKHRQPLNRPSFPSELDSFKEGTRLERTEASKNEGWEMDTVEKYDTFEDFLSSRNTWKTDTEVNVEQQLEVKQKGNLEVKVDVNDDFETRTHEIRPSSPSTQQFLTQNDQSQNGTYRSRPGFEKAVMIRIPRETQQEKLRRILLSSSVGMSLVVTSCGVLHEITRSLPRYVTVLS